MIIAGTDKLLMSKILNISDSLPTTSGIDTVLVWRESDSNYWDGSTWVSSGVSAGVPDHYSMGNWGFVLSGVATSAMADDSIFFDMSDNIDPASVTVVATGGEHKVWSNEPSTIPTIAGLATASGIASVVDDQLTSTHGTGDWLTATGLATLDSNYALLQIVDAKVDSLPQLADLITASGVAIEVDTLLTTNHNSGSWTTASGFATPADLLTLPQLSDLVTTSGFATVVDSQLTTTHGIGNWTTASGFATSADLTNLDVAVSTRAAASDLTTHNTLLETVSGNIATIDTIVDTINTNVSALPSATDIDTELTSSHGAGDWTTAATVAVDYDAVASGVDSLLTTNHGSGGWTTAASVTVDYNAIASGVDTELTAQHGAGAWTGDSAATIDALLTANHGAGDWTSSGVNVVVSGVDVCVYSLEPT